MTERVVLEQWDGQRCQRLPVSLAWQGEYGALDWRHMSWPTPELVWAARYNPAAHYTLTAPHSRSTTPKG